MSRPNQALAGRESLLISIAMVAEMKLLLSINERSPLLFPPQSDPMSTTATHISCHHCGSRVPELELQHGEALRCGLCKSVVKRKRRSESFQPACAFAIAGSLFLALANIYPIMNFNVAGNTQTNEIITGVRVLIAQGYWPIAVLVFFCAMLAPSVYFAGVAYVSLACMAGGGLPGARKVLAGVRLVQPWSLVPVFAAACLVAAVKLDLIGTVFWQPGVWWIALLAGCALALGSLFDAESAELVLKRKAGPP
jgi:paraquat-inducible protein A